MDTLTLATTLYLGVIVPILGWLITRRIDRLEASVDRLPTREEFNGLGSRVGRLEAEVAALRSDLTQVALAVGARTRPQTG